MNRRQSRRGGEVPGREEDPHHFFVGGVMKEIKRKGNPGVVNEVLRKKLEW